MILSGAILTLGTLLTGTVTAKILAPLYTTDDSLAIRGKYIVFLKEEPTLGMLSTSSINHRDWLTHELADWEGSSIDHFYDFEEFSGYSGEFTDEMLEMIRERPEVDFIEQDQVQSIYRLGKKGKQTIKHPANVRNHFMAKPLVQSDAPWGISRVSQREIPSSYGEYIYPESAGEGVDVYVIDTGINVDHVEFEGRAKWGKTIPKFDEDADGNGHGTHCAGTIGSKTYGIAKKVNLIAVKVLRSSGYGSNSDVLKGIEWVADQHRANTKSGKRSLASMSLGGGRSLALDKTVNKAVDMGVHFAVAAGNDNADACDYSPAAAENAVTVGASDRMDNLAYFSNHGSCVDIMAPGVEITSTWIGSSTAKNTISGTSMATPHVAGVMALYLAKREYSPVELKKLLAKDSSEGKLKGIPTDTINLLLNTNRLLEDEVVTEEIMVM